MFTENLESRIGELWKACEDGNWDRKILIKVISVSSGVITGKILLSNIESHKFEYSTRTKDLCNDYWRPFKKKRCDICYEL